MNNLDIILLITSVDRDGLQGRDPHPTDDMIGEEVRVLEMRRYNPMTGKMDMNGELQVFSCLRRPGLSGPSIVVLAEHELEPVAFGDCAEQPMTVEEFIAFQTRIAELEDLISQSRVAVKSADRASQVMWREVEDRRRESNRLTLQLSEKEGELVMLRQASKLAHVSQEKFIVFLKSLCRQAYHRLNAFAPPHHRWAPDSLEMKLDVAGRTLTHDAQYTDPRVAELEAQLTLERHRATTGRFHL